MDFICVNRYAAWYSDSGLLSLIERQTVEELKAWHDKWQRPIIMSEYGAGSLSGFHKVGKKNFERSVVFVGMSFKRIIFLISCLLSCGLKTTKSLHSISISQHLISLGSMGC